MQRKKSKKQKTSGRQYPKQQNLLKASYKNEKNQKPIAGEKQ